MAMEDKILEFKGDAAFLSNFAESPFNFMGGGVQNCRTLLPGS